MAQLETCPACGKRGVEAWKIHKNPHTSYTYPYKTCRYCYSIYTTDQWAEEIKKRTEQAHKDIKEKNAVHRNPERRIVRVRD